VTSVVPDHEGDGHEKATCADSSPLPDRLCRTGALADPSADIEGVKAASKAFYEAVVVVDDGTAMDKVWAHKPYVTYVGPKSTSIIVGWTRKDILAGIQQGVHAPDR